MWPRAVCRGGYISPFRMCWWHRASGLCDDVAPSGYPRALHWAVFLFAPLLTRPRADATLR
eukprot:961986-Alexandrium_andersonii.AAC.1